MIQLLFGVEPYLISDKVSKAKSEVSGMGYARFEGFSNEVAEFASQYPFCDPKQVIVIEVQCLKNDDNILSFIQKVDSKVNDIYFVAEEVDKRTKLYKYLDSKKMIQECKKINEAMFKKFVFQTISNEGGSITIKAYGMFVDRCGYFENDDITLYTIKTYVYQLLFAGDDKIVDENRVLSIVPETLDNKTFQLTNLILQRDKLKLFILAKALIEAKESPIGMLSLLLRSFRLAYKASLYNEMNEKQLTSLLGVPAYQYKGALRFSPAILEKALEVLQDGVNMIKSGAAAADVIFYITLGNLLNLLDR